MIQSDEGYGYEWDAMLIGGPADGCLDRVIEINGDNPPAILKRILDGNEIKRETLGEKLIEYLTTDQVEGNQRVAVYRLREITDNNEKCLYNYIETIEMSRFRIKYEVP
jgi:hypothetical protein